MLFVFWTVVSNYLYKDNKYILVGLLCISHCHLDKHIFLGDIMKLRVFVSQLGKIICRQPPWHQFGEDRLHIADYSYFILKGTNGLCL